MILSVAFTLLAAISVKAQNSKEENQALNVSINEHYAKADSLKVIMKRYAEAGLPGIAMQFIQRKMAGGRSAAGFAKG
jgi:hypothetical protein